MTCRVLNIARQPYYRWLASPVSDAFGKKPGPPVHDDRCAVVDKHGVTRHVFTADAVNELWLADITEHWTREGKVYLCAIKDVYSNRIVG